MQESIIAFRLLAASQVVLWFTGLSLSANPPRTRAIGVALGLGILSYLLIPLLVDRANPIVLQFAAFNADAIPAFLLLFCWELFEDERPPRSIYVGAVGYLIVASLLSLRWDPGNAPVTTALSVAVQLAKLAFAAIAIAIIWRGRKYDLLEARLKLRRLVVASLSILVIAVILVELITGWEVPEPVEALGMTIIFLVALATNLSFWRINPRFALLTCTATPKPAKAAADPLIGSLLGMMEDGQVHTEHDLRVASLAARLRVPEYKLRRAINSHLGYRNFNHFINRYRIEDAARRLVEQPSTPVLTIALDVGFRSLSSFNAAFRASFDMSPTEYRARATPNT